MASPVLRIRERFRQVVWASAIAVVVGAFAAGVSVGVATSAAPAAGKAAGKTADKDADKDAKNRRPERGESSLRTGPVYPLAQLATELSLTEQQIQKLQPIDARVAAARVKLREQAAADAKRLREAMEEALKERPDKGDKEDKKARITSPRAAIQSRMALLGADLAELEEEWLDAVASVCNDVQLQKLKSLRDPVKTTAPATVRRPDTPVEVLVEQLNELGISAEQREKLAPAIEEFRRANGELVRRALGEIELILTPDQRSAADKAAKDRRGELPPDYLLRSFESLRPAPTAEQKTKFAEIKARADAGYRAIYSEFVLDLRDVLSEEQITKLEKIRGPLVLTGASTKTKK